MDMVARYKAVKELSKLLSISKAEASEIIRNMARESKKTLMVN